MMYRRPKHVISGYRNEVTGPWVDNDYYTNYTLANDSIPIPDGNSTTILKSDLTRYWDSLDVGKVSW